MDFKDLENRKVDKVSTPKKKTVKKETAKYKGKKFKYEQGVDRQFRISACEKCGGNPDTSPLNLPGFQGVKCNECFEVLTYKKV